MDIWLLLVVAVALTVGAAIGRLSNRLVKRYVRSIRVRFALLPVLVLVVGFATLLLLNATCSRESASVSVAWVESMLFLMYGVAPAVLGTTVAYCWKLGNAPWDEPVPNQEADPDYWRLPPAS